jgi:hypothetical protein
MYGLVLPTPSQQCTGNENNIYVCLSVCRTSNRHNELGQLDLAAHVRQHRRKVLWKTKRPKTDRQRKTKEGVKDTDKDQMTTHKKIQGKKKTKTR